MTSDNVNRFFKQKIILVLWDLELGGAERQVMHLARYLKKLNAHVEIWGLGNPGHLTQLCDKSNITWRVIPIHWIHPNTHGKNIVVTTARRIIGLSNRIRNFYSLCQFALELRKQKADLILPYMLWPNVFCCSVWHWSKAKMCIWNQRDGGINLLGDGIERYAAKRASLFITNSGTGKDFLITKFGVSDDEIRVIHNGVKIDLPECSPESWKHRLLLDESCFTACMIANLHLYKDHETLLKAWKTVVEHTAKDKVRAVLLLAGAFRGTDESLKALAYDLGLYHHVLFLGQVEDIAGLLSVCDLGVFSSTTEGCPNGVLECMAVGLPVVATDIPGIREAVGPNGFSHLAPPGDVEAFADRIIQFYENKYLQRLAGRNNADWIRDHFSVEQMCINTIQAISETLNRNNGY
jgi:glycosyltransferase involved in cell wall biosynthesis